MRSSHAWLWLVLHQYDCEIWYIWTLFSLPPQEKLQIDFVPSAGHGKLIMADGSYYEGQFVHGEIEGHGFRYFGIDGSSYSGEFYQGEMHGQGVLKKKDGSVYEGQFNRNRRSGKCS